MGRSHYSQLRWGGVVNDTKYYKVTQIAKMLTIESAFEPDFRYTSLHKFSLVSPPYPWWGKSPTWGDRLDPAVHPCGKPDV